MLWHMASCLARLHGMHLTPGWRLLLQRIGEYGNSLPGPGSYFA